MASKVISPLRPVIRALAYERLTNHLIRFIITPPHADPFASREGPFP